MSKKYSVGVDLGGTSIKVALANPTGELLCKKSMPTRSQEGYKVVFQDIAFCIKECLREASVETEDLKGVGLATPGLLSEDGQEILFANNLGFKNVKAVEELSRNIQCPVFMTNDANAAALGEHLYGAGKGSRSSVTLTIGTGIGSGIILDNHIVSGAFNSGGELGHHIVEAGGLNCPCGQRGCMELYASASALIGEAARQAEILKDSLMYEICGNELSMLDAFKIYKAYNRGDLAAVRAVEKFIRYLGIGVINTINFLQPEVVIIGGGVSAQGENLTGPLTEYVKENILSGGENLRTKIRHALLGNDAGVIGAMMLCE